MKENDTNIGNFYNNDINEGINDSVTNKNHLEHNSTSLRKSKKYRTEKDLDPRMFTYLLEDDPKIFEEAISLPDANL